MTNLEFSMKELESRWIQLPEEVRASYGQNYLEKCRVNIKLANDSFVLKHSKSGRLVLYISNLRSCNIYKVYPCYQCVIANIDRRYNLIRFQQFLTLS